MLADFIRQPEFDIIFTQEVTSTEGLNVRGYNKHLNIGASILGTAILAKSTLHLTNITNLPSGRAIAANYKGIRLINVYAPSGTARRTDREQLYTTELPYLFHDGPTDLLIGGDFNCVLHPGDTTGQFQPSRALTEMIRGLELHDAWNQNPACPTYTYYSPHGATRLDRFYITSEIQHKKKRIEIIPAAFTDHYTVAMSITVQETDLQRARGRWKMDPILINDEHLKKRISLEWVKWQNCKRYYPDITMWWERCVKTPSYPDPQRTART